MTQAAQRTEPAEPTEERPRLRDAFARVDRFDLALRLTLLLLVLNPGLGWLQRAPLQIAAGLALVIPGIASHRALWFGLSGWMAFRLFDAWPHSDNHDYLTAYWCLAVALALGLPRPADALARSSRWLIGLCFAFACLWKLALSPEFVDGTFFRLTLLFDARFADLARLAGNLSLEAIDANDLFLRTGEGAPVEPAELRRMAWFATGWTALSELGVAALFLWPRDDAIGRARDFVLLTFLVTTYAIATVAGFGWLLAAMGAAQCSAQRWRIRAAYVGVFFLIAAYRMLPWLDALADALST